MAEVYAGCAAVQLIWINIDTGRSVTRSVVAAGRTR
jgi:hypothetical protein